MNDEDLIAEAAKVIRQGDSRVGISLRGPLADLLDGVFEHGESEYPCCDAGIRLCYEFGAVAMKLVDEIVRPNGEGKK